MRFAVVLLWLAACSVASAQDADTQRASHGSREARANGSYDDDPMVWFGYAIVVLVGWAFLPVDRLWPERDWASARAHAQRLRDHA